MQEELISLALIAIEKDIESLRRVLKGDDKQNASGVTLGDDKPPGLFGFTEELVAVKQPLFVQRFFLGHKSH